MTLSLQGARGRQLLVEKFSFDAYIPGLEAMFERVIVERQGGGVKSPAPCKILA